MATLPWGLAGAAEPRVSVNPEITILSTMVANFTGTGEWGFSALVDVGGERILFDTGFRQTTVFDNARALGVDLGTVETVILTHFHTDHTGGLLELRRRLAAEHPRALTRVYVGRGFFQQRYSAEGHPTYSLSRALNPDYFTAPQAFRSAAEALGITFTVVDAPLQLLPGVYLTGPIARVHDERNVSPGNFLDDQATHPDTIPDSQVLGFLTEQGWVLLSGCGHAGIVNAGSALRALYDRPIHLAVGGFHLFRASPAVLDWTTDQLREFGLETFVGAHCTGTQATFRIAEALGLPHSQVSIGAVGTRIDPQFNIVRSSVE